MAKSATKVSKLNNSANLISGFKQHALYPLGSHSNTYLSLLGGIFGFLDTFEERSLKLRVSQHEQELNKTKLNSELSEVHIYSRGEDCG